jgi:transglutaminase-like putative cysteine protease
MVKRILWKLPGVIIWLSAAGTLAAGYTSAAGMAAAIIGAFSAFAAAEFLSARAVRLPRLWLLAAAMFGVSHFTIHLLLNSGAVSGYLGSGAVYSATEIIRWTAGFICCLTPLLVSARRYPLFLAVEAALLVSIFSSVLAAHRGGFINRPFFVTDWLLERNYDPLPFFMGGGILLGILLVIWLFSRSSARRTLLDPVLIVALIVALFIFLPDALIRQVSIFTGNTGGSDSSEKENPRRDKENAGNFNDPNPDAGTGLEFNFPVAVVNLHDDYDPPYGAYYFRQDSQSSYNGRRLVRDVSGHFDTDTGIPFPAAPIDIPLRGYAGITDNENRHSASLLKTTVALMAPHSRPFSLIDAIRLEPAANPDPRRFERAYIVESLVLNNDFGELTDYKTGSDKWTPQVRDHYIQVSGDPRYRGITEEAMELLPSRLRENPVAQAQAVKTWLDRNTTYDCGTSSAGEDSDPVADFLFGERRGYCTHLAHSAVYLFRTLGIPSRVSIGYMVDARQRGSGSSILIRGSDAHAWPEIYIDGLGWAVFDISPERILCDINQENADPDLQRMLGEMARNTPGSPGEDKPPPGGGDLRKALLEAVQKTGKLILPLIALILAVLYGIKIWRRMEPRFCPPDRLPVAAYRSALDALSDFGFHRGFGVTRERFAQNLSQRTPELGVITGLHMRHALGADAQALSRRHYLDIISAVSRNAGHGIPWWRRALGLINPVSWWRVS